MCPLQNEIMFCSSLDHSWLRLVLIGVMRIPKMAVDRRNTLHMLRSVTEFTAFAFIPTSFIMRSRLMVFFNLLTHPYAVTVLMVRRYRRYCVVLALLIMSHPSLNGRCMIASFEVSTVHFGLVQIILFSLLHRPKFVRSRCSFSD